MKASEKDNVILMEGDIVIPNNKKTNGGVRALAIDSVYAQNAPKPTAWRLKKIPYMIKVSDYAEDQITLIRNVINNHLNSFSCLKFEEHPYNPAKTDIVEIFSGAGCYSFVGFSMNTPRKVSLDKSACMVTAMIQHELLHAAGFYHEMMREDRDEYVRINWEHAIFSTPKFNYAVFKDTILNEYDYQSVMHYYITNGMDNHYSMLPVQKKEPLGSHRASALDKIGLNMVYHCKGILIVHHA
ncbi:high choriolytic enzyme 1-like [Hydractinia symbiolongicarpus]|uniref:high choriolytic enzyme 1-like n=1 Tax=Hydractinia symbiolongicarpus TaxID=13093 RepID=UPI00254C41C3|nr:high choriolytic enzyme 1-like [Hydractinia symbiolongicarpus]